MKAFDDVNGVIVGGDYSFYKVIAPSGKEQKSFYAENDNFAIEVFHQWKEEKLRECKGREDIMELIYGKGNFDLRCFTN